MKPIVPPLAHVAGSPLIGSATQKLVKGEFATTYGTGESPFPPGLAVGTIVRSVDPSTATAEHALLRPVVDLDSLSIVKVLRYRPAGTPCSGGRASQPARPAYSAC